MNISYAITVKNEINEIKRLISLLQSHLKSDDEIVVQMDTDASKEVREFLDTLKNIKVIEFPLNNHFANFKNNLNNHCSKEYIFQIDSDELVSEFLLENIHTILDSNNIDLYWLPRINTVEGLTKEYIQMWKWNVNKDGWVNFPDYQSRLFRRDTNIKWKNPVHEQIYGHKTHTFLPAEKKYALIHHKILQRQIKQNEKYEKIIKNG